MCELVDAEVPVTFTKAMVPKDIWVVIGEGLWMDADDYHFEKYQFKCKHHGRFKKWEDVYVPKHGSGMQLFCEPGTKIKVVAK